MPTYQYACTECGHEFEAFQSFSDDTLTVCPNCGGKLRKVYGSVGVVFKGSGFYRTDSRSGSGDGTVAKAPDKPKEKAAKGDSKSGDSSSSSAPAAGNGSKSASGSDGGSKSSSSTSSAGSSFSGGSSSGGSSSSTS